jgi:hypothetical protein
LVLVDPHSGDESVLLDSYGVYPDWAPDASKVLYLDADGNLMTVNSDGTSPTLVRAPDSMFITYPEADWQPIPVNSYPRPAGATPIRVSLVPAYLQCTEPNRTHGPPLAFPSCGRPNASTFGPPTLVSPNLILGTPDHNGHVANSTGFVRLRTMVGDPATPADEADVTVAVRVTDVRCSLTISPSLCDPPSTNPATNDYVGDLELRLGLRITDKNNTPSPSGRGGAATVQDTTLSFAVPCTGDGSGTIGSTCSTTTTVDAVVPGAVAEGKRAVWGLGRIQVFDGGADGQAGTADNTLFMTQGVFVP